MMISRILAGLAVATTLSSQEVDATAVAVKAQLDYAIQRIERARFAPELAAEKAAFTSQFERDVDDYISASFQPGLADVRGLERKLGYLWGAQTIEDLRTPRVLKAPAGGADHLFIVYFLHVGGETAAYLKVFRSELGRYKLLTAGETDFSGFGGGQIQEVRSGIPGEVWFAIQARHLTANGFRRTRLRVYGFNGASIRTVWSPEDLSDASLEFEGAVIRVNRIDRERYYGANPTPPYRRAEEFEIQADRIKMVSSRLVE
jgi:hypothetical protein